MKFPGAPRARGGKVDQNRKLSKKWKGKGRTAPETLQKLGWVGNPQMESSCAQLTSHDVPTRAGLYQEAQGLESRQQLIIVPIHGWGQ